MADWYVRHGAANNGDGTAENAAATPGGVGAWNNLEAVRLNSGSAYGISPGDRTFVMGGVQVNLTGNRTWYEYGTEAAPVEWIAAGDSVFTGATNGSDVTTRSFTSFNSYQRDARFNVYSYVEADNCRWRATTNNTGSALGFWAATGPNLFIGYKFDAESASTTDRHFINPTGDTAGGDAQTPNVFVDCWVRMRSNSALAGHIRSDGSGNVAIFDNLTVDLTDGANASVFETENSFDEGSYFEVNGVTLENADASNSLLRYNTAAVVTDATLDGAALVDGFTATASGFIRMSVEGIDGRPEDFFSQVPQGRVQWRGGQNYPYAAATLADGTSMSWRAQPTTVAADIGRVRPWRLPTMDKITGHEAAAALTVNVPILVVNTVSPTDRDWWIGVQYTDEDGIVRYETSRGSGSALPASAVSWNTLGYGAATYVAYDLTLDTAHAVKVGSKVRVTVHCERVAGSVGEDAFISPDPNLSEA